MSTTITERDQFTLASATSTITRTITLGSATKRRIVAIYVKNTALVVSSVTFNGTAMTAGIAGTGNRTFQEFYYDVPDALGTGSYDVVATLSGSSSQFGGVILEVTNAATGAPEDTDTTSLSTTAAITRPLTSTTGAAAIAVFVHVNGGSVAYTNATLQRTLSPSFLTAAFAWDANVTAGTVTITADETPDNATTKWLGVMSIAVAPTSTNAPRSMFYHLQGMR